MMELEGWVDITKHLLPVKTPILIFSKRYGIYGVYKDDEGLKYWYTQKQVDYDIILEITHFMTPIPPNG